MFGNRGKIRAEWIDVVCVGIVAAGLTGFLVFKILTT